jgi:hypothetical protein
MTYPRTSVGERGVFPVPDRDSLKDDLSSFDAGYVAGWNAILGSNAVMPAIPTLPDVPTGKTHFQTGVLRGIEDAKNQISVKQDD